MSYLDGVVYLDGRFVAARRAKVSVFDRGLLYGDGLFETLRSYRGHIFGLDEHIERLQRSCSALGVALPDRDWRDVLEELLERNRLERGDAWLRLNITRGSAEPAVLPPQDIQPTVFAIAKPVASGFSKVQREGARITLLSYSRNSFMPEHKSLNYLPTILGKAAAAQRGAYEGLFVRDGRYLMEGTTSSFFVVRRGALQTPPIEGILPGVTRRIIRVLAEREGIAMVEKKTSVAMLRSADEAFVTSSVAEIVPVVQLDDRTIASGRPGPITKLLQRKYRSYARRVAAQQA